MRVTWPEIVAQRAYERGKVAAWLRHMRRTLRSADHARTAERIEADFADDRRQFGVHYMRKLSGVRMTRLGAMAWPALYQWALDEIRAGDYRDYRHLPCGMQDYYCDRDSYDREMALAIVRHFGRPVP